jgi:hypothetical protein
MMARSQTVELQVYQEMKAIHQELRAYQDTTVRAHLQQEHRVCPDMKDMVQLQELLVYPDMKDMFQPPELRVYPDMKDIVQLPELRAYPGMKDIVQLQDLLVYPDTKVRAQ